MWTRCAALCLVFGLVGCSSPDPDAPADVGEPSALGHGARLHELTDPDSPKSIVPKQAPVCGTPFTAPIEVSAMQVSWIDRFDETKDGKSAGTIYMQDFGAAKPFAGTSLYSPSFVPPSLAVEPGDVLDLRGTFQMNACIGTAKFPEGSFLPQIAYPIGTFRYDSAPPEPIDIDLEDLNSFETGRRWHGVLVRVKNVRVSGTAVNSRRFSAYLNGADEYDNNRPALSNEFWDLNNESLGGRNVQLASVTGVVTWFFSFKIATRSAADLVKAEAN